MDNIENNNIFHHEFEDYILSEHYLKKCKAIRDKADRIYHKKINAQDKYLKRKIVLFQKWMFISNKRRGLLLKQYSNLIYISKCVLR
ncbi:hypothetical protein Murru_3091 [Allomuricauda ruestringensis DSM 13258]|uniref:Uncharacterized protein n=1 Tax=Allomuricauda ruestringensis (strain DSM 13258 / CIP 107369 / LMG 19739 / B1) TaxID=886377 RepID=G2PKR6_ALLRU|nr:hypothetical protein Murru_3091 [Allomuricauda ruestringensis DSM 13258]